MRHRPQHLGPRSLARRHQRALAWLLGGAIVLTLMTLHGDNQLHRRAEAVQAHGQSGLNLGALDNEPDVLRTRRDPRPLLDAPVRGTKSPVPTNMDVVVERVRDRAGRSPRVAGASPPRRYDDRGLGAGGSVKLGPPSRAAPRSTRPSAAGHASLGARSWRPAAPEAASNWTQAGIRLAVLVPLWRSQGLVEPLLEHLHSHIQAQAGIADYRVHIVEQDPAQNFTPGLLVNVGLAVAAEVQALREEDVVVYQQPTLLPAGSVPYSLAPGQRFLHLATGQSFFGGRLPYPGYCGGAWAMRVGTFRELRGMANQYVGFEGLEDDLCHRVEQLTRNLTIPGLDPARGRFTNRDEAMVANHLAALHRPANQRLFRSRWQAGNGTREIADAVAGTAGDGLHALPEAWRERLAIREEAAHHTWWLLGGPPDADGWAGDGEPGDADANAATVTLLSRDARSDVGLGDTRALLSLAHGPIDYDDLLA
uniref:Uncharacterized protein n=1 Tax=Auxenochlorella protothecoides TaxID=3075 RepID=A0A1D1ZRY2_AUXPR